MHPKTLLAAAIAAVGLSAYPVATEAAPSPTTSSTHGAENFDVRFTSNFGEGDIILGGTFDATGKVGGPGFNIIKLPKGRIQLNPTVVQDNDQVSPTCEETDTATGIYTLSMGTHRYSDITGGGKFVIYGVFHDRRLANGTCDTSTRVPGGYHEFIIGTGTVDLRAADPSPGGPTRNGSFVVGAAL